MADIKVELKNSLNSKIYPRTTLDNIVKSVASSTTLIASGGVIKKDFLDLTGLIDASYVSSANVIPTSAINGLSTAITNGASTYVHSSNVIPTSAINAFTTAAKNAASTYVNSSNVIPTSAINGLSTAITNGASSYVVSSAVAKSNVTSDYNDIKSANEVTTKIPNAYAVREFLADYSESVDETYQKTMSAGFGMVISGGTKVELARTRAITTIPAASTTVTLQPGEAYIIDATTTSKTLNVGTITAGHFGLESHIELFVVNTGYVHVGSNVTLVDPLEPDAVNNCTVRFHDGHAIISVEDHVGAYMVNGTGTGSATSGTLAYGLKQTSVASSYIGFRSELNTSSVPTGGATATVMKHIVGNGMDIGPTITGNLIVKSGATIRDAKLSGVTVTSGNAKLTNVYCAGNITAGTGCSMTLGDVYIHNGSTVAVSGGGLAIEKVTGDGGTVDLGGKSFQINPGSTASVSGCVISGGSATFGGAFLCYGDLTLSDCVVSGNTASRFQGQDIYAAANVTVYIKDSTVGDVRPQGTGNVCFVGNCKVVTINNGNGYITISSGASIMLTSTIGNLGSGHIAVVGGTCTVNGVVIAGGTYTSIVSSGGSAKVNQ